MKIVAVLYGGRYDGRVEDIVGTESVIHFAEPMEQIAGYAAGTPAARTDVIVLHYDATGRHRIVGDMDQREFVIRPSERLCPYCSQPINGHTHALGDVL